MGDKEDGFPFRREIAHDLQQLLNLLGGQHGGRLVENQDLVVPVQHFQNFRALLHTDGDVLDQRVRIDPQAVFFRQRHDLFPGAGALKNAVLRILVTEDDVVQHGEALHQLEMLVNHADAQSIGIVGVVDFDLHAVLFDHALFGLIKAEQNAHQRGFSGAVFTQQGVYLALFQLERNIVVSRRSSGTIRPFPSAAVRQSIMGGLPLPDGSKLVCHFLLYTTYRQISNKIRRNWEIFW